MHTNLIYSQTTIHIDDSSEESATAKSNRTNGSERNSKKSEKNLHKLKSDCNDAEEDVTSDKDKVADNDEKHVRST